MKLAYGVVPIASNVSSIPLYLLKFQTGRTLQPKDINGFVTAIQFYVKNPMIWKHESNNAVNNAHFFTYSYYLEQVKSLLQLSDTSSQKNDND